MAEITKHLILTSLGEQLKKDAVIPGNLPLAVKYMAVGDGGGTSYGLPTIDPSQQRLQNEIWRDMIVSLESLEQTKPGCFLITGYIPPTILGSVYLKEVGIFTVDNQLIFLGHLDNFFKPSLSSTRNVGVIVTVEVNWGFNYGIALEENMKFEYAMKTDIMNEDDPLVGHSISKPYLYFMVQIPRQTS